MSKQRRVHPIVVFKEKYDRAARRFNNHYGVKRAARNRRVKKLDQQLLEYEWDKEDEEIRHEVWEETARQYRM